MWALATVLALMMPEGHSVHWGTPNAGQADIGQDFTAGKRLPGRALSTLVELEDVTVEIEQDPDSFVIPGDPQDMTVSLRATVFNPLESEIRDLDVEAIVLTASQLEFVWKRIHLPPLQLTPEEISVPMPVPLVELSVADEDTSVRPLDRRDVRVSEEFSAIAPARRDPAAYLANMAVYTLVDPTLNDVMNILDRGGPADLGAVAGWASRMAEEGIRPFDDAGRSQVIARIVDGLTRLRAPPGRGDFQRLSAYTTLMYACARPQDLERLLALKRPVSILLASAVVSYDAAANEEDLLGMSVHGFRRLHSPSEPSVAWNAGMTRLRMLALDRLVRLAYDPIDFRFAPEGMYRRSPLHGQAIELLSPIAPTQADRLLSIAEERPDVQRDVLKFYIDVRHAPAVETIIEWVVDHPEYVEDIGYSAVAVLGDQMVPVLLRRYLDLDSSAAERLTVWRILGALPQQYASLLARLSRSLGVDVDENQGQFDVSQIMRMIEQYDQTQVLGRIDELVRRIENDGVDRASLRLRLRAVRQLSEVAPNRLMDLADEVIELHVIAVREYAADNGVERRTILRQLDELPLGDHHKSATMAAALVAAELAVRAGNPLGAADILEKHDSDLREPEVRKAYAAALQQEYATQMEAGAWDQADLVLDRAEVHVWDLIEVPSLRRRVNWMRNRPLIIVGAFALVAVLVAAGVVAYRAGWIMRSRRADKGGPTDQGDEFLEPGESAVSVLTASGLEDIEQPPDTFAA